MGGMALGVRYQLNPINRGNTAELYAALREREGVVPQEDIASVEFIVQLPSGIFAGNPSTLKKEAGPLFRSVPAVPAPQGFGIRGLVSAVGFIPGKTLIRGA